MKKYFFLYMLLVSLFFSCADDETDVMMGKTESSRAEINGAATRSATDKYSFEFDVFPTFIMDNYHTFLVAKVPGNALHDRDPFCFMYDDNDNIVYAADYSQYNLLGVSGKIFFGDDGFLDSFPYDYDFENGIGKHNVIKVGDTVAIFASKERYTNEDLKAHDGDSDYFSKVSESFECYYITTVKPHTTIVYGMYDCDWCG